MKTERHLLVTDHVIKTSNKVVIRATLQWCGVQGADMAWGMPLGSGWSVKLEVGERYIYVCPPPPVGGQVPFHSIVTICVLLHFNHCLQENLFFSVFSFASVWTPSASDALTQLHYTHTASVLPLASLSTSKSCLGTILRFFSALLCIRYLKLTFTASSNS